MEQKPIYGQQGNSENNLAGQSNDLNNVEMPSSNTPPPATNLPKADEAINQNPLKSNGVADNSGFNSGNPFQHGTSEPINNMPNNTPPPAPSADEKVGIRTMASDMESIKQSGGEMPQSEVITAPIIKDIPNVKDNSNLSGNKLNGEEVSHGPSLQKDEDVKKDISTTPNQQQPSNVGNVPPKNIGTPSPKFSSGSGKSSSNIKTTIIIIGIILGAVVMGFGVYYLVSSLGTTPVINTDNNADNINKLSIDDINKNQDNDDSLDNNASSTQDNLTDTVFVHNSYIKSPNDMVSGAIDVFDSSQIRAIVKSLSVPMLPDEQVRDISFSYMVSSTTSPVESSQIFGAYFPQLSVKLSPMLDKDFTSWIYFDDVNDIMSPKFGLAFKLADDINLSEVSPIIDQIENYIDQIAKLFVDNVSVPASKAFNDGAIGDVSIRFLQFASGNVFEYGLLSNSGGDYIILGTSYKQMVDIINRLSDIK